jgi:integrase
MSPHRIRHSAITAALDATDGNVRKVQKLSRHRQLDTLMIYDDNRGKTSKKLQRCWMTWFSEMSDCTMTEEQWLAVFLNS